MAGKIAEHAEKEIPGNIRNIIEDVREDVLKDLEDASVSIRVESEGKVVEINADTKGDRLDKLQELEEMEGEKSDTLKKEE